MVLCHLVFNDKWRNAFNSNYFNWFLFGSKEFDKRIGRYVLVFPDTSVFFDCSCNIYRPKKKFLKLVILEKEEQPDDITCSESSGKYCSEFANFELDGYVLKYGCESNGRCYILLGICSFGLQKVQEGKVDFKEDQIFRCDNSKIFCSSLEKFGVEETVLKNLEEISST